MMTDADGLLFNADDVRTMVIRARMLGEPRESVLAALMRRVDDLSLTDSEVQRIFDEEWPTELQAASK